MLGVPNKLRQQSHLFEENVSIGDSPYNKKLFYSNKRNLLSQERNIIQILSASEHFNYVLFNHLEQMLEVEYEL